jgi:hypothetical protein
MLGRVEPFNKVAKQVLVSSLKQQLFNGQEFWVASGHNGQSPWCCHPKLNRLLGWRWRNRRIGGIRWQGTFCSVERKNKSDAIERMAKIISNGDVNLLAQRIISDISFQIGISIKPFLGTLVPALFNRFCDTKLLLRLTIAKIFNHLMNGLSSKTIVNVAVHNLQHENAKVWEEIINCLIVAMLLLPNHQDQFDWQSMVFGLNVGSLKDHQSWVCFVALEAAALISSRIGNEYLLDVATLISVTMRIESFPLALTF